MKFARTGVFVTNFTLVNISTDDKFSGAGKLVVVLVVVFDRCASARHGMRNTFEKYVSHTICFPRASFGSRDKR